MNGKIVGGFIVISALLAGATIYWLQEYAFYTPIAFTRANQIELTLIETGLPEPILAENVTGVNADSSPIRFRACFTTPQSMAMLTETYKIYEGAQPLNAPSWFPCFDAGKIGDALESGEAVAFLSQANIAPDVDRVVAIFPDGRAFAWQQFHPGAGE
ncbi:MAG: DUF6446 family protein [Cypionkella sp.]